MKILVLTTLHAPDDDRIYHKEVLSLYRKFSDIVLVAPHGGGLPPSTACGIRFIPLKQRSGPLARALKLLAATRVAYREKPDIIHFHDFDILLAAPILKCLLRCRLVYDAHEDFPAAALASERFPKLFRPAVALLVGLVEIALAQYCALIFTADDPTAKHLRRSGVRVCTLFNYPRLDLFPDAATAPEGCQYLFDHHDVIIYQGSMSEDRGLFQMIGAMPRILQSRPECRLLLIGLQGALYDQTMSLVDRLGVREAVVVLPWVEHQSIHRYLSHSKIGLVPLQPTVKFRRNIPIKLFEYMACGLPVLGADSTSVVPYVRESGAGRLYDSTSFEALARGVVTMLGDVVALRRMGENGRKAVREKWNWSKMEDRLLAVYDELSAVGTGREKGSTHSSSRATPSQ